MKSMTNKYALLIVGLLALTLTACASKENVTEGENAESVIAEEAATQEAEAEGVAEAVEPEPSQEVETEATAEATTETVEEVTVEPVIYEGIDMESTLPAGEWTGTFLGIINEPKFVVTNSETNKKVIVEEGQKVVLEEGDVLGVYTNGGIVLDYSGIPVIETENIGNIYKSFKFDTFSEETVFKADVATLEGNKTITCILVPNN